jgi:hypothetical protein
MKAHTKARYTSKVEYSSVSFDTADLQEPNDLLDELS